MPMVAPMNMTCLSQNRRTLFRAKDDRASQSVRMLVSGPGAPSGAQVAMPLGSAARGPEDLLEMAIPRF